MPLFSQSNPWASSFLLTERRGPHCLSRPHTQKPTPCSRPTARVRFSPYTGGMVMLIRFFVGLAFLVAASALTLWGMWSGHMLSRSWVTGLAFALATIATATTGAVILANAVTDGYEQ